MANDSDLKIPISDLPLASELDKDDLLPVTQGAEGHYTAYNTTIGGLRNHLFRDVEGVLTAGSTSLVLQSPYFFEDSTVDVYTTDYAVSPKTVIVTRGYVTLGFKKQNTDIGVKVRVS